VVLFTDFPDVAANRTPEDVFSILSPGAEDFFADQSYGRMQLSLRPHFEWLRLSGPASEYSDAIRTFEGHRAFIQEAVDLADDAVDFTGADEVVVIATPNASAVGYGPTWMGGSFPNGQLTPDGTSITNGITSGADLLFWEDLWLPHEMGHSLGLPDLYSYSAPDGFTRPFSIMDLINSEAPGFMAYSRWILGWLDDDQIGCVDSDLEVALAPIETDGGLKAAMVPIDRETALLVESRRAIGYDAELSREGAVVYVVDTGIWSGEGPIVVLNDAQALLPGDSLSYEHVTVTVLGASANGDTIRIELSAG
jgi:M6 family metalloprotease-like protein